MTYPSSVRWSYYDSPIDRTPGRVAGNSRIWGDASPETQKAAIDAILDTARNRGLSTRETAHVLAIARTESGFNPDAAAGTTSASGLGQFIDKTGQHYGLNAANRWNVNDQAGALVDHFIDNRDLAAKRGLGEDHIYKFHHDGPVGNYKGLRISQQTVMPLIDGYEAALRAGEPQDSGVSATNTPSAPETDGLQNQGDFGSGDDGGSLDSPPQLAETDHDAQPTLTDEDEAEMTPGFAMTHAALNGSDESELWSG